MKRGSNLRLQSGSGVIRNDRRMGGAMRRRKMNLEYCVISPVTLTSHFRQIVPKHVGAFLSKSLLWRTDCHRQSGVSGATVMAKTRRQDFPLSRAFLTLVSHTHEQMFFLSLLQEGHAEHGCSQCKGSGCAPCSLCHGSKFSMLANRFRESYRALRCPACNESGLQPCHICAA